MSSPGDERQSGEYGRPPSESIEERKARLRGAADALSATTRSGEDIKLDKDAAHAVLEKAEQIRDSLRMHQDQANSFQQMTPPSQDMASEAYNKLATSGQSPNFAEALFGSARAFDAGKSEIDAQMKYLNSFIVGLKKALGITVSNDEDAAKVATQAGTSKTTDGGYI